MKDAKEKELWDTIKNLSGEIAGLTSENDKPAYKDAMDVWYIAMKHVDPDLSEETEDEEEDDED